MTDDTLERWISNLLRAGVIVAAAVVALGGLTHLVSHAGQAVDFRVLVPDDSIRTIPGILSAARRLQPDGIVQFGLLLLIATPILRVIFAAAGFLLERDYLYLGISLTVLAILVFSMFRAA